MMQEYLHVIRWTTLMRHHDIKNIMAVMCNSMHVIRTAETFHCMLFAFMEMLQSLFTSLIGVQIVRNAYGTNFLPYYALRADFRLETQLCHLNVYVISITCWFSPSQFMPRTVSINQCLWAWNVAGENRKLVCWLHFIQTIPELV